MTDHSGLMLLKHIASEKTNMLALVKTWAEINSGSGNFSGLACMAEALKTAFSPLADDTQVLKAKPWLQLNKQGEFSQTFLGDALLFRKRPQAKTKVLFMGHMDTVFGADHPFQKVTTLDTHRLQGPGVADLKGGLVVLLNTLKIFETLPEAQNIGWEILINADEELGSRGSQDHIVSAAKRNHLGLVFEPSLPDGSIVGERKGIGNFTVASIGKSAHAGRDHASGRSAILALSEFIVKAESLNGTIDKTTLNVGKIEGGESVNSVPAHALCHIDVRVHSASDFDILSRHLQKIADEISKKSELKLILDGQLNRPPKPLTQSVQKMFDAYARLAHELNLPLKMQPSGGCCDGNNLLASGLPNLDTLGVRGGQIHSHDEYMIIDSLVERTQLNFLFLRELAQNQTGALKFL